MPQKTEALFGPKKLKDFKGRKVFGDLPDKNRAKSLAKGKGADTIREGLKLTTRSGFKPHWSYCWIGYKGDQPVGCVVQEYQGLGGGPSPIKWEQAKPNEIEPLGKPIKAEVVAMASFQHKREMIAVLLRSKKYNLANAVAWGGLSFFDPGAIAGSVPKSNEIDELVKLFARRKALDKPGVAQKLRLRVWKEFQRFYDKMASKYKDFDLSSRQFWNELEKRAAKIQPQVATARSVLEDSTRKMMYRAAQLMAVWQSVEGKDSKEGYPKLAKALVSYIESLKDFLQATDNTPKATNTLDGVVAAIKAAPFTSAHKEISFHKSYLKRALHGLNQLALKKPEGTNVLNGYIAHALKELRPFTVYRINDDPAAKKVQDSIEKAASAFQKESSLRIT
jgi:hypothetical protein